MSYRPLPTAFAVLAVAAAAAGAASGDVAAAPSNACPAPKPITFSEPLYVDQNRAGGEPIVFTYPSGRLLYGSHAGSTHFYTPAAGDPTTGAFVQNYRGQTYYWYSDSNGGEWKFAPRATVEDAAPTGFSDPEFAVDAKGNVFVSEINLANVAVWKSNADEAGSKYTLQNATSNIFTDRQWMEADEENVIYMVSNPTGPGGSYNPGQTDYQVNSGHTMYKSVDGGKTWTKGFKDPGGLGDIRVDKRNGTVYEAHYTNNELSIVAFRDARKQDFKTLVEPEKNIVFDDVKMLAHWPAFDLDPSGNLYITWDEDGSGTLEAGIYYSYSTDTGKTWAKPQRVNTNENTAIWPWLGVGDDGRVGIAWLEADKALPNHNAEVQGTHGWRVVGATTITGLGCAGGKLPSFAVATMTAEPIHTGTICQSGTTCQATLTDRRLGDYFSVDVDAEGMMYAGYSDTRQDGAISLPGFVRQNGGDPLIAKKATGGGDDRGGDDKGNEGRGNEGRGNQGHGNTPPTAGRPGTMPSTGLDLAFPVLAALFALTAVVLRRRTRTES